MVATSTSEGWGYYYDRLWPLDQHSTLWLILVRQIGSWDLIRVRHVRRGYGLGARIYTPRFFTLFLIRNHSLPFHPRVPLAHTMPLANAWGWKPLLLGGPPLLVGLLLIVRHARCNGLWKLENLLHHCHWIQSQRSCWYNQSYGTYVASFSWSTWSWCRQLL